MAQRAGVNGGVRDGSWTGNGRRLVASRGNTRSPTWSSEVVWAARLLHSLSSGTASPLTTESVGVADLVEGADELPPAMYFGGGGDDPEVGCSLTRDEARVEAADDPDDGAALFDAFNGGWRQRRCRGSRR